MKRKGNPITRKELTITSRSMRFSWGLFGFEACLTVIFLIAIAVLGVENRYSYVRSNARRFSSFIAIFPAVSIAELCIVALIIPVMTATLISGEKERQTFDIMLTTQIKPMQIVVGKMMSSVIKVMTYVIMSIPIMAVGFTLGGISWWALLFFLVFTLLTALLEASVGIFCSAVCKRSITSILLTYFIMGLIYMGTFLPIFITALMDSFMTVFTGESLAMSGSMLALLPNPVVLFVEYFSLALGGESYFVKEMVDEGLPILSFMGEKCVWLIISSIVILLISYLFLRLAARAVDPLRGGRGQASKAKTAVNYTPVRPEESRQNITGAYGQEESRQNIADTYGQEENRQ